MLYSIVRRGEIDWKLRGERGDDIKQRTLVGIEPGLLYQMSYQGTPRHSSTTVFKCLLYCHVFHDDSDEETSWSHNKVVLFTTTAN